MGGMWSQRNAKKLDCFFCGLECAGEGIVDEKHRQ